jgi:hypothetical protein
MQKHGFSQCRVCYPVRFDMVVMTVRLGMCHDDIWLNAADHLPDPPDGRGVDAQMSVSETGEENPIRWDPKDFSRADRFLTSSIRLLLIVGEDKEKNIMPRTQCLDYEGTRAKLDIVRVGSDGQNSQCGRRILLRYAQALCGDSSFH